MSRCCALLLSSLVACGAEVAPPDASPPSTIPDTPAGSFTLRSELDLAVPEVARPVLASLTAAVDGPDDPARFLIDHLIASLPEGPLREVAAGAAPYVAAYLNARLHELAPRLSPGLAALGTGLTRIASHLGTIERLQVSADGDAARTITAIRFTVPGGAATVTLSEVGLPDLTAPTHVSIDATGHLQISAHHHALPYGALLRLGLTRAVVPSVSPGATGLAQALAALVDCTALGNRIADQLGLGASLFTAACDTAMTAVASEVEARIADIDEVPMELGLAGQAQALDSDHDGSIDELHGLWTGSLAAAGAPAALRGGSFTGTAP